MFVNRKFIISQILARTMCGLFLSLKERKMAMLTELAVNKSSIISGITNRSDLERAIDMGATYAGLIFVLTSPYGIAIDDALEITKDTNIPLIGIFQNSDLADIIYVAERIELHAVLLNGWETQTFINQLRECLPHNTKIIKIAHMSDAVPKMDYLNVDFYLLGGHVGEHLEPNWDLLQQIDLHNVFISNNWKDRSLLSNLTNHSFGFETNIRML